MLNILSPITISKTIASLSFAYRIVNCFLGVILSAAVLFVGPLERQSYSP